MDYRQVSDGERGILDQSNEKHQSNEKQPTGVFGMLHAQCPDADLSPDIRTRAIWSSTMSQLELISTCCRRDQDFHRC
jgi:hypothetical protein